MFRHSGAVATRVRAPWPQLVHRAQRRRARRYRHTVRICGVGHHRGVGDDTRDRTVDHARDDGDGTRVRGDAESARVVLRGVRVFRMGRVRIAQVLR